MQADAAPSPHPGLVAARAARAAGPGSDAEELRAAYLDLLKLALCDLTGTGTGSVGLGDNGVVASRELAGDQLCLRAAGMDWPLHGLTMVGLARLDDLQRCVESVVRDGVQGDVIEAGVWRGGASILMRATLDALGDVGRTVWVADSFQGFPEPDGMPDEWSPIDYLGVPLEDVRASFARFGCERGVRFVPGFFDETLPGLSDERWSIVRLDGDTYDATWTTLESLYPGLSVGGYLVVDDYGVVEECARAVEDFRSAYGIGEPLEEVDWTCVRWRRESEAPTREQVAAGGPKPGQPRTAPRSVARPRTREIPTLTEVELKGEVAALRERLAAAEAEVQRLQSSPPRGPRAWLRRRLAS